VIEMFMRACLLGQLEVVLLKLLTYKRGAFFPWTLKTIIPTWRKHRFDNGPRRISWSS